MNKYTFVMAAAVAVALAAGSAHAGRKLGAGMDRAGNGVQLNGIAANGFAVETVELPGGATVVERSRYEARASGSMPSSAAHCWPWTRWRCPIAQR